MPCGHRLWIERFLSALHGTCSCTCNHILLTEKVQNGNRQCCQYQVCKYIIPIAGILPKEIINRKGHGPFRRRIEEIQRNHEFVPCPHGRCNDNSKITEKNVLTGVAPSINAASSSSLGTFFINPDIVKIVHGICKAVSTSITPIKVPESFRN